MHIEKTALRVRYVETDAQGIVHHSAYLPWLEMGRIEFCRSMGLDYRSLEAEGYYLAVVSLHLNYLAPAFFDDSLRVVTQLVRLKRTSLQFHYEVFRELPEEKLTEAEMVLVLLDRKKRPVPFPPTVRNAFLTAQGGEVAG